MSVRMIPVINRAIKEIAWCCEELQVLRKAGEVDTVEIEIKLRELMLRLESEIM